MLRRTRQLSSRKLTQLDRHYDEVVFFSQGTSTTSISIIIYSLIEPIQEDALVPSAETFQGCKVTYIRIASHVTIIVQLKPSIDMNPKFLW